jgi:hypothetical protein
MKGTIICCLEELVKTKFGQDKWDRILEKSGWQKGKVTLATSTVEDAETMKVIQSTCAVLGISLDQASDAFGEFWMAEYAPRLYPAFFTRPKTAREFLLDLDRIHVSMTKNMVDAKPPRFTYEWPSPNTLIMHYQSHRNLLPVLAGLARGVGKKFGEHLVVTIVRSSAIQVQFPG